MKIARQRQTIVKREMKGLEQRIEFLTRKLYKLTTDTKQAEEHYVRATNNVQSMDREQVQLEKVLLIIVILEIFSMYLFCFSIDRR